MPMCTHKHKLLWSTQSIEDELRHTRMRINKESYEAKSTAVTVNSLHVSVGGIMKPSHVIKKCICIARLDVGLLLNNRLKGGTPES